MIQILAARGFNSDDFICAHFFRTWWQEIRPRQVGGYRICHCVLPYNCHNDSAVLSTAQNLPRT